MAQIEYFTRIKIVIELLQIGSVGEQRIIAAGIGSRKRQILQVRRIRQIDRAKFNLGKRIDEKPQFLYIPASRKIKFFQIEQIIKLNFKWSITDRPS